MNLADWVRAAGGRTAAVLARLLGDRSRGSPAILCYHGVLPTPSGVSPGAFHCTPEVFRKQLSGLQKSGYRFVPLAEMLAMHQEGRFAPRTLTVTFDDGYANVLHRAYPILRELGIPATVFVCTGFVDSKEPLPFDPWCVAHRQRILGDDYRHLSEAECFELTADGLVDLGTHTHTHADFRGRAEALRKDLAVSCQWLTARFGRRQYPFAFPFGRRHTGHSSEELIGAARAAGVSCALSTECGYVSAASSPYHLGRFLVYAWDSASTLRGKLNGYYAWIPRWQSRLLRKRLTTTKAEPLSAESTAGTAGVRRTVRGV